MLTSNLFRPDRVLGPEGERLGLDNLPPANGSRWTPKRKAQIVAAVAGGLLSVEEACATYSLSLQEFADWRKAIEDEGLGGLRAGQPHKGRGKDEQVDPIADSTEISLSPTVPAPTNRRKHHRSLSIFRVGKFVSPAGEELCRIRNISPAGIAVDLGAPRTVGEHVSVEICEGAHAGGTVVWVQDTTAGVAFDEEVDIGMFLTQCPPVAGQQPRSPRVNLTCRARLTTGTNQYVVNVRNVSQGGFALETDDEHRVGTVVAVSVEGLRTVRGVIAWSRDGAVGIMLDQPLAFEELATWLTRRLGGDPAPSETDTGNVVRLPTARDAGTLATGS